MSDLLSIGSSGVRAYQSALNVVGENIANASTDGYVRRDVLLREITPGAKSSPLEINKRVLGGVNFTGVDRQWDQFRAVEVRASGAELSRTEAGIVWLERIESTLSANDISGQMTRFFNGAEAVAADPTGLGPRAALIETAEGLAASFRLTGEGLGAIASDLAAQAQVSVTELNNLASSLATTNGALARVAPGTNAQAQLLDERDRLIDSMSKLGSVTASFDDRGVATVRLNETNGPILVEGSRASAFRVEVNSSGTLALTHDVFGNPQPVSFKGGSLAGLADAAVRVADVRAQVDAVAVDFAAAINTNQATGADLDGNDGALLFAVGTTATSFTLATSDPRDIAAAGRWTVDAPLTNGGNARLTVATDPAATPPNPLPSLRLSLSGGVITAINTATNSVVGTAPYAAGAPVNVAGLTVTVNGTAADGDSFGVARTGADSRDNANLMALRDLRSTGGFEGTMTGLVTSNASTLAARRTIAEAQGALHDGALAARDAVSGVNLDNEAVELIRFQQAYQASSRIIQVSREIFDSLIQAT